MHALPLRVEVRAFEMNAEDARHLLLHCCTDCSDRFGHVFACVGDKRRQQPRSAVAAVRGGDGPDTGDGRLVVEEHPAAAVHLDVDETRREQAGYLPGDHAGGQVGILDDGANAALVDDHRLSVMEMRAVENPGAGKGERHQRVSVTFLRCGGRSGSRPRARATASASG